MKKAFCVILSLLALCGCGGNTDKGGEARADIEAGVQNERENGEISFTQDDFVLIAEDKDSGTRSAVIWLGMDKGLVNEAMKEFTGYYEGIDTISYNTQAEVVDDEATENTVDYVSLISYSGSREYLETEKGIRTAGLYDTASKPNSTAEDVIAAYGLDPENESVYIGSPKDDSYTIALYFDIDNHSNVTRLVSEKGADVSDIANVPRADYFLKFIITQGEVTGVQMYRQRPVDAG